MHRHEHRPGHRRVVGHQLEQHQPGADRRLAENQHAGHHRAGTRRMPGAAGAERGDDERGDGQQRQTAGRAV